MCKTLMPFAATRVQTVYEVAYADSTGKVINEVHYASNLVVTAASSAIRKP
jgi:hypothetical protein